MKFFRRLVATCATALFLTSGAAANPADTDAPQSNGFPIPFWYSLERQPAQHLESMIAEFEATHKHLDIQPRNFRSAEEMYRTMEKGEKPMFAVIEGNQLARLDNSTDLTEVEDWMPREQFLFSWSVKHDVYGALFKGCSVDDRLMARPFFYSTTALIYNPDMLAKGGVKAAPLTWKQVDEASEKIKAKEPSAWGFGFGDDEGLKETLSLMLSQQDSIAPSESVRNVVNLGQEMALTAGTPDEVRHSGQLAMRTGTVEDYLEMRAEGLPVRTAGVPGPDAKHRRTEYRVWSLGMFPVESHDLYKAQEFAFWLMDFNQQRNWAENTPYLSAHVKVFDNPFYRQARSEDHKNLRVFVNLLNRADMAKAPAAPRAGVMSKLQALFPKLLKGEMTSEAAMSQLAGPVVAPRAQEARVENSGSQGSANVQNPR